MYARVAAWQRNRSLTQARQEYQWRDNEEAKSLLESMSCVCVQRGCTARLLG